MLSFLRMIFYENGSASLTRVLTMLYFILFAVVSLYLAYTGKIWGQYELFAIITGSGGVAPQLLNKFINSKYNSAIGEPIEQRK